MAILEIKKYPNPILREKSKEVREITEEIKNLGQEMVKIVIVKEGVGLAGPQVGQLKRIIVVCRQKGLPEVFINPKIVKKNKETEIGEEGCLSFPDLYLKIKRAKGAEIEALDIEGKTIYQKAEGLSARVFQHEIDHLDGILFIDRISFWQRFKLKRQLK